MKHVDDYPRKIVEHADIGIVMSDGCRLSARVWMPIDAEVNPVPAILEHLPYRKRDGTVHRDELTHPWFAGHGYVCIRVDMRGNGDSEGAMLDEYTSQEWQDAIEVIAWASASPWCSGAVGMMGISWGGFNALQVAALRPPALKAIITLCSTVDRFADDIHYKGGCLLGENIGWAANMLSYSSRPPDPLLVGDGWRVRWQERLQELPFLASTWLAHQRRDAYWRHGSVCEDYAAIDAAVLTVGGWHDGYRNAPAHLTANLTAPVKAIVGPWNHKYPHCAAPEPAIGFLQEALRWWNCWLGGNSQEASLLPDYRAWLMDSVFPERCLDERPGRWITEVTWPSSRIAEQRWRFDGATLMRDPTVDAHHGDLLDIFIAETHERHADDPRYALIDHQGADKERSVSSRQDCGECGGEFFPFAFGPELPAEQSADDARSLLYDSAPTDAAIDIVGAPIVHVRGTVRSGVQDPPDQSIADPGAELAGMLAVRLCDVAPDGTSALITTGFLNLAHRDGSSVPVAPRSGETLSLQIVLDQIAYRLPEGHRLRVAVSTSYWPLIWPSPTSIVFTVMAGTLVLPERPLADGDEYRFDPPEAAAGWRSEMLRESHSRRDTERDPQTGIMTITIDNDFGERRDADHGLVAGSRTLEHWRIHPGDPLSAHVEIRWEQTGGRDDWQWRTNVFVQMHGDATHFHIEARLRACENQCEIFQRKFADSIPRDHL